MQHAEQQTAMEPAQDAAAPPKTFRPLAGGGLPPAFLAAGNRVVAAYAERVRARAGPRALQRMREDAARHVAALPEEQKAALSAPQDLLRRNIVRFLAYHDNLGDTEKRALHVESTAADPADVRKAKRARQFLKEADSLGWKVVGAIADDALVVAETRGVPAALEDALRDSADALNDILNKWYRPLEELGIAGKRPAKHFDPAPDLSAADYKTGDDRNSAIPLVWYKSRTDYRDFSAVDYAEIKRELGKAPTTLDEVRTAAAKCSPRPFTYPDGPSLAVRNPDKTGPPIVERQMRAPKGDLFTGKDAKFQNARKVGKKERTVEAEARAALERQGADLAGRDIDHVLDLGFGGDDAYENLWPLDATINQRPWRGWRSRYGFHYRSDDTVHAGVIEALPQRWFTPKDYLQPGDGPVPREGEVNPPDAEAGRETGSRGERRHSQRARPLTDEQRRDVEEFKEKYNETARELYAKVTAVRQAWAVWESTKASVVDPSSGHKRNKPDPSDDQPRKKQKSAVETI